MDAPQTHDLIKNVKCRLAFQKQTYILSVKGHIPIFSMNDPGKKREVFTKPTLEAIGNLFKEVRPAPVLQQENSEGSHCSTSPWKPHLCLKGCKIHQVQRTARAIYSVKRVLLIQVINASWFSGTAYAYSSKVTNYSANQGPWYRIASFHRCHQQIWFCSQIP